jgi:hypothetical protein
MNIKSSKHCPAYINIDYNNRDLKLSKTIYHLKSICCTKVLSVVVLLTVQNIKAPLYKVKSISYVINLFNLIHTFIFLFVPR